jgi:hypothetical protein
MVRAIFIDPVERNVSVARVPDVWHDIRMKYGAKLVRVAVMPCGDAVYVAEENKDSTEAFRLGCSAVFGGWGLLLGRKGQFGVNRLANLTPHRRPILTPLRGELCW